MTSASSQKARDDFHRPARPKVLPVIQFDYAVAGTHPGQPLNFSSGTDVSAGAAWASTVLIKRQGYMHCLIGSFMVVSARTFNKSSSSQTVSQRQKSSCARYSQKRRHDGKAYHVRSSNNRSDTATRATEEQNEWYKPFATCEREVYLTAGGSVDWLVSGTSATCETCRGLLSLALELRATTYLTTRG